jgi:hypothetical protein
MLYCPINIYYIYFFFSQTHVFLLYEYAYHLSYYITLLNTPIDQKMTASVHNEIMKLFTMTILQTYSYSF